MKSVFFTLLLFTFTHLIFSQQLIPYRVGDKWGYSNEKGEIVIKPKYEEAGFFNYGMAWVKRKHKYAYRNKWLRITRFKFDRASNFAYSRGYVKIGDESFCINKWGRKIECVFGCVVTSDWAFPIYQKEGKLGIIVTSYPKDETGQIYEKVDSLAAIWDSIISNQNHYAAAKKDSFWGVINLEGKEISPCIYEKMEVQDPFFREYRFIKIMKNEKWGFLNEKGELVVETKYHKVGFFNNQGFAKVWLDEHFWGYIDETGKEYFAREKF